MGDGGANGEYAGGISLVWGSHPHPNLPSSRGKGEEGGGLGVWWLRAVFSQVVEFLAEGAASLGGGDSSAPRPPSGT